MSSQRAHRFVLFENDQSSDNDNPIRKIYLAKFAYLKEIDNETYRNFLMFVSENPWDKSTDPEKIPEELKEFLRKNKENIWFGKLYEKIADENSKAKDLFKFDYSDEKDKMYYGIAISLYRFYISPCAVTLLNLLNIILEINPDYIMKFMEDLSRNYNNNLTEEIVNKFLLLFAKTFLQYNYKDDKKKYGLFILQEENKEKDLIGLIKENMKNGIKIFSSKELTRKDLSIDGSPCLNPFYIYIGRAQYYEDRLERIKMESSEKTQPSKELTKEVLSEEKLSEREITEEIINNYVHAIRPEDVVSPMIKDQKTEEKANIFETKVKEYLYKWLRLAVQPNSKTIITNKFENLSKWVEKLRDMDDDLIKILGAMVHPPHDATSSENIFTILKDYNEEKLQFEVKYYVLSVLLKNEINPTPVESVFTDENQDMIPELTYRDAKSKYENNA